MMPERFIIFFLCLQVLGCSLGYAQQDVPVYVGDPVNNVEGRMSPILDEDRELMYLLETEEDGNVNFQDGVSGILQFNKALELDHEIKFTDPSESQYPEFKPLKLCKLDSGFILLGKHYAARTKDIKSYLFLLDESGMVIRIVNPASIQGVDKSDADFTFFRLSRINSSIDSSKHYVLSVVSPSFLESKEKINFIIYDENLDIVNSHLLDYPDDLIEYNIQNILSSGGGLFFIRVEISNPFKDGETIHQLVIYDIHNDDFNSFELNFVEAMIKQSAILKITDEVISLYGYFVKGVHQEEPEGVFYYLFDATNASLLRQHIYEFTDSEKALIDPANNASTSAYQHFKPAGIHLTRHNHLLLLMEYRWQSILLIRDQEGMMYDQPYHYANEGFVLRFDAKNELVGSAKFPKKQMSGNGDDGLGFVSCLANDALYLIYNDNPRNRKVLRADKLKTMKRKFETMLGKYDLNSGQFSKVKFGDDSGDLIIYPAEAIRQNQGKIILNNRKGRPGLISVGGNE